MLNNKNILITVPAAASVVPQATGRRLWSQRLRRSHRRRRRYRRRNSSGWRQEHPSGKCGGGSRGGGLVQQCVDHYGSIDGIYANAGVSGGGKSVTELTVEDWQRTGVNTVGVFLAVKHSLKHFLPQARCHSVYRFRCRLAGQCGRCGLFGQQGWGGQHRTDHCVSNLRERCSHQRHLSGPH